MTTLTLTEIFLRLGCSFLAGGLLGLERESHGRAAGLRTTLLICMAACMAMLVSADLQVPATPAEEWRPDPARLAAGVLTGMGFVGAGTIIHSADTIRGVTTAAVLWFATMLGLAFGGGFYSVGFAGTAIALVALLVLPLCQDHLGTDTYARVQVVTTLDGVPVAELKNKIQELGGKVHRTQIGLDRAAGTRTVSMDLKYKSQAPHLGESEVSQSIVERLFSQPGVLSVQWN